MSKPMLSSKVNARAIFSAIILLNVHVAFAADINLITKQDAKDVSKYPDCNIVLVGPLLQGDARKFSAILNQWTKQSTDFFFDSTLCLDSPGGNLSSAVEISRLVNKWRVATYIPANSECFSACAFIFMAGNTAGSDFHLASRTMHVTAALGFHAPFLATSGISSSSITPELLGDAYRKALLDTQQLLNIFVRPQFSRYKYSNELWMKPSLLRIALATESAELFYIDSIGKLGNYSISITGYSDIKVNYREAATSGCVNAFNWANDRSEGGEEAVTFFGSQNPDYKLSDVPAHVRQMFSELGSKVEYLEIFNRGSGGVKCAVVKHEEPDEEGNLWNIWLFNGEFENGKKYSFEDWQILRSNVRINSLR